MDQGQAVKRSFNDCWDGGHFVYRKLGRFEHFIMKRPFRKVKVGGGVGNLGVLGQATKS